MIYYPLETKLFTYQHILDSEQNLEEIKKFSVKQQSGRGLENYIRELGLSEIHKFTAEN